MMDVEFPGGTNMKKRTRLYILSPALLVLVLTLAACEKDRPIQTPVSSTPQLQGGQALTPAPGQAATRGATTAVTPNSSPSSMASPVPSKSPETAPTGSAAGTTTASGSPTRVTRQGTVYTVQFGDTLGSIAEQFDVSMDAIIRANSLTNPDVLMVGQELKIPAEQEVSTGSGSGQVSESVYVVSAGDTLGSIAKRFGVSEAELQTLNDITDPNEISVGQQLRIPASASEGAEEPTTGEERTYVVEEGDTLSKIAVRFGVTIAALQAANDISDPDMLYPGQVLTIP
jgi:LysM repeat protein